MHLKPDIFPVALDPVKYMMKTYELRHEISNNVTCATSKSSDQPAYMHCDKIPHKMVAKSLRMSRTRRKLVADPSQFSRNHFGTRHICEINKTELRTNCDINETLRDNIASKLN